jgi:spermidine synthase
MDQNILWEGDTVYGHYQVVDTLYDSRPARVLYSGDQQAAQSGVPKDANPDMLFDYNQRMFELATSLAPGRLLLIGGAVGTLPTALLHAMPGIRIDVAEPDSGLTDLAYRFFDLPVDDRLRIFHTDGRSYLRSGSERYDMILVDAFVHTAIPKDLRTAEAFAALMARLKPRGVAAMNVISGYHGQSSHILRTIFAAADQSFRTSEVFLAGKGYSLWLPQNFVLASQKSTDLPMRDYVRYPAVDPPQYSAEDILHDE